MINVQKQQPEARSVPRAFTLVETLVVVALASMILVSVVSVFNRTRTDAAVITEKLDENRLANEVLQRIAEDIDRLAAPGFDAVVQINNKTDNGFFSARLIIDNKYYDSANPPKARIYERVIWVSTYDAFEDSLLLYRMHDGLNVEDKILDENKEPAELSMFIPMASGITYFEMQAMENQKLIQNWTQPKLPKGIRISISFAPMEQDLDGHWSVPEDKILHRTVAIDRTRAITYKFKPKIFDANDFLFDELPDEEPEAEEEDNPEELMEPEPESGG